jgi:hypothetical protein
MGEKPRQALQNGGLRRIAWEGFEWGAVSDSNRRVRTVREAVK